ncbi:MAG TPA: hypothetical protein VMW11_06470 [Candidatus Dormibacteraeota bacterium]|nr:hypothetical protein [Candidatus Dormibacteraeota bacterium]
MSRSSLPRLDGRTLLLFGCAVGVLALTFRPTVEGDGIGYFVYLHALLVGHTLDLSGEYRAALAAHIPLYRPLLTVHSVTGLAADFFPIGPAILSSPAYLVALATRPSGQPSFGAPFTTAFAATSLALGLVAPVLSWGLVRSAAITRTGWSPVLATVAAVVATPYLFYLLYEPGYSHTFSAALCSAFFLTWWLTRDHRSLLGWFLIGLLGGLMATVRFQDGLFVAVLLLDLRTGRIRALAALPGILLGFAPQMAIDLAQFGSILPSRPLGQALAPWPGHYLEVLLSSHNGLFSWSPATLLAAVGLFFVPRPALRAAGLYAFAVQIAINGSAPDWWGGASFGMRRFLDLLPFFVLGLATLFELLPRVAATTVAALLGGWNVLLLTYYEYVLRADRDPGYLGMLTGQVAAIPYLPHVLFGGDATRNIAEGLLARDGRLGAGLLLLLIEALCVAAALVVARLVARDLPPTPPTPAGVGSPRVPTPLAQPDPART